MMRLLCNGEFLDLPNDAELQFTKKNILFAFDDIECERSASFSIPATAHNNKVFGLAYDEHMSGAYMRIKMNAQLQSGVVSKNGYLYLDSYDYTKRAYNAIFVTGELVGLQNLRNAGDVNELYTNNPYVVWSAGNEVDASSANSVWQIVNYKQAFTNSGGTVIPYPSYNIMTIVNAITQALGASDGDIQAPSSTGASGYNAMNALRVIPKELRSFEDTLTIHSTPLTGDADGFINDIDGYDSLPAYITQYNISVYSYQCIRETYPTRKGSFTSWTKNAASVTSLGKIKGFKTLSRLQITFPDDFPSNYALVHYMLIPSFHEIVDTETPYNTHNVLNNMSYLRNGAEVSFLNIGSLSYSQKLSVQYANLAGSTITLADNATFAFINLDDIKLADVSDYQDGDTAHPVSYENNGQDYFAYGQPEYSFALTFKGVDMEAGEDAYLQPNLPSISVIDMLKGVANTFGWLLNYTDADGIMFENLADIADWGVIDISSKVIEQTTLMRKFGDYAQRNVVQFKSGDNVLNGERLIGAYLVPNESLEETKDIATIPYSEAGVGSDADGENTDYTPIYIRNGLSEQENDEDVIAIAGANDKYLGRVPFAVNDAVISLCDNSTSVKVKVWQTLHEFEQIVPKCVIYMYGAKYVWTEADWSDGVTTLSLSKIS